ncbi:MAG: hypothetical protein M0R51_12420 [Clostridia bacterium]|jgi:hypothetical protein|nr:hypothetical protein [Clostridia bacterium]
MIEVNKIHCLFEQSGSFKNTFKQLGYSAFDYDILDDFNETDYKIDLFNEIERAYINEDSIFDNFSKNDLIISFFPCTYFSTQNDLHFSGKGYSFRNWSDEKKQIYINERLKKREFMFQLLLKYINICKRKNIKMVFENPYRGSYLLKRSEIKKPDIIIKDRRVLGDTHIKPTGFWFYNFEPTYMSEYTKLNNEKFLLHNEIHGSLRSHIHEDFALNFINKYILGF